MNFFIELFRNEPLMTAAIAWGLAALLKFLIVIILTGKVDWERLLGTGGMPSTHTTPVVACTMSLGLVEGFDSGLFGLGVVLSFIVAYDAAGIRRHAGEQAKAINSLIHDVFTGELFKGQKPADFFKRWKLEELETLLGHNPADVAVGIAVGIIVALLVHFNFGHLFS